MREVGREGKERKEKRTQEKEMKRIGVRSDLSAWTSVNFLSLARLNGWDLVSREG
jgi:hypothetical protein